MPITFAEWKDAAVAALVANGMPEADHAFLARLDDGPGGIVPSLETLYEEGETPEMFAAAILEGDG